MSDIILPFSYERLGAGEIRLLHSCIDAQTDAVIWSLETVKLADDSDTCPFDALSYTWGELTPTFPFICDRHELRIHENLRDALPVLARRCSPRPIWIDAVCINQSDETEKMAQVRLMYRIYSKATQVWIWLGKAIAYTEDAIRFLPQIPQVCKRLTSIRYNIQNNYQNNPSLESMGLPEMSSPIWSAILNLLCNTWFYRLWAVQEAALAKELKVLCGGFEIEWSQIKEAIDDAYLLQECRDASGRKLPTERFVDSLGSIYARDTYRLRKFSRGTGLILDILAITSRAHKCLDPRDRVMGVLGFFGEQQPSELKLTSETSLDELYTSFFQYLLVNGDPTRLHWWNLLLKATTTDKRHSLPSWCPDFHEQPREGDDRGWRNVLCRDRGDIESSPYRAGHGSTSMRHGSSHREIQLRGKLFDQVSEVFPEIPGLTQRSTSAHKHAVFEFDDLAVWEDMIASEVLSGSTDRTQRSDKTSVPNARHRKFVIPIDDYWRTLIGNVTKVGEYIITHETYSAFRNASKKWVAMAENRNALIKRLAEKDTLERVEAADAILDDTEKATLRLFEVGTPAYVFWIRLTIVLAGMRLFTTSTGRLGYGSPEVAKGDAICIFDGARTPHLLRGTTGSDACKLVGEAYVHGMMNGEVESLDFENDWITLV